MRPLGVGLVFSPKLLPLLREGDEVASVIEIEPQTLWQLSRTDLRRPYLLNGERLAELASLPQAKLLHSVGMPVGGSRPAEAAQVELVRSMTEALRPVWASEHLSFNVFRDGQGWASAGFLLPPRQVPATVAMAARRVRELGSALECPVAFETGVNYLSLQPGELADGDFFRSVAEEADCGILLDLHNLWANARNGRSPVRDVLAQLPLERVWEVHLAGGMEFNGYWLDAHCGAIPDAVLEIAGEWIPRMPNLGALIFEILDEHVAGLGLDGVARQLDKMRHIWALRPAREEMTLHWPTTTERALDVASVDDSVRVWENSLGALVIGRSPDGDTDDGLFRRLSSDAGLDVLRQLVFDSRAGFVSQGLRQTMTLLLGNLGPAVVRGLLQEFMHNQSPELFVSAEADSFARFLKAKAQDLCVPYLEEVLGFEHALIRAVLHGECSTVTFKHEPSALFDALEHCDILREPPARPTTLVIDPR